MKKSKQCPKCESIRMGLFPEVALWMDNKEGGMTPYGGFDLMICEECGYSELYVAPLPKDRAAAGREPMEERGCKFRWLNPKPEQQGPFR